MSTTSFSLVLDSKPNLASKPSSLSDIPMANSPLRSVPSTLFLCRSSPDYNHLYRPPSSSLFPGAPQPQLSGQPRQPQATRRNPPTWHTTQPRPPHCRRQLNPASPHSARPPSGLFRWRRRAVLPPGRRARCAWLSWKRACRPWGVGGPLLLQVLLHHHRLLVPLLLPLQWEKREGVEVALVQASGDALLAWKLVHEAGMVAELLLLRGHRPVQRDGEDGREDARAAGRWAEMAELERRSVRGGDGAVRELVGLQALPGVCGVGADHVGAQVVRGLG
ncbi:hypothetical protein BC567DRAFT_220292 [Phyllosticta citribraziliensis]